MNNDSNFEEQYKKFVDLRADYLFSLAYALKEVKAGKLLFSTMNLDLSQRKNNYISLIPLIEQLKEKFKQIVIMENKLANLQGFSNRLELYLAKSGIPREKYDYFLKNFDRFVSMVHADFPLTEVAQELEKQGVKEWTELNAPFGEVDLGFTTPFRSPNDVIDMAAKFDRRFKKNEERIRIVEKDNEPFNKTIYLPKEGIVEIQINKNSDYGRDGSLHFVTMLGVALEMLKYADKGKAPDQLPRYLLAHEADKFTLNFVRANAPERTQKYFRFNLLRTITFAFFVIDIYTNDQQDFDVAFARAVNRCYLKARQTKNPFYVFKEVLITFPMEDLMHSINYVELYLEDEKIVHTNKNI